MASEDEKRPAHATPPWTSEFDGIRLGPACHIQRAESRFGPHVLEDIRSFVYDDAHGNQMEFDDDEEDDEEEEDEDDEDDMDVLFAQLQPSAGLSPALNLFVSSWEDNLLGDDPLQSQAPPVDHGETGAEPHGQFPRMARLRCNLTALSQRYNLYFTAYQDKIYVYQPKAPPEILPPPCLILNPKRTKAAKAFGGVIDRTFPHQMNQLVVGNLGNLEVILFAYDDGDVGAYYTHTIARAIVANSELRQGLGTPGARPVVPRQFFTENVGQSAWGIAIHEKSRLLAVSSNRHEVTVFAFAMNSQPGSRPVPFEDAEYRVDTSPMLWCGQTALALERDFRSRTRTWRIVLPIGLQGHNIPTVAFADNESGEAEHVVALDVNDHTWILDIWRIGANPIFYPGAPSRAQQRVAGWGVLVLPDSSFKRTRTVRETLGVPQAQVMPSTMVRKPPGAEKQGHETWLDTTCSLYYVKDLSMSPQVLLGGRYGPLYAKLHSDGYPTKGGRSIESREADTEDDDDTEMSDSPGDFETTHSLEIAKLKKEADDKRLKKEADDKRWENLSHFLTGAAPRVTRVDEKEKEKEKEKEFHLSKVIVPSFGQTPQLDGSFGSLLDLVNGAMVRKNRSRTINLPEAQFPAYITKNLSILRATTTDIELIPFDSSGVSIQCKAVLSHVNYHSRRTTPYDLRPHISERMSMLIHVPELNLVVVGSLNGRVALLTLTKTRGFVHGHPLRRGFRVDWVLPRKEEEEKKIRPWCTLHGIAMSPVPSRYTKGLEVMDRRRVGSYRPFSLPIKYRLILHYVDHTILMYDIEKRGDDVLIF